MASNILLVDQELLFKLEFLRLLSTRENATLGEIAGELGVDESTVLDLYNKIRQNYMISISREMITWHYGDNPARIKPWGWSYTYRILAGSTMVVAKHLNPWSIVVTEYQLRSYGRHGKQWISNLGGLWTTFKIEVDPNTTYLLAMAIPVVIARFLREKHNLNVGIKWPNDIVYKSKKLAGFLIEVEALLNRIIAYIGIGINVNNEPPLETATSLKNELGKLIPRNSLIGYIAGYISKIDEITRSPGKIHAEYMDLLETLGRRVKAELISGGVVTGLARTITESGELVVESETGSFKLRSAEVLELRYID